MTKLEKEIIKDELQRMIDNSLEVLEKCEDPIMKNYERGMIRGLERSLSTIEDLDAIKENRRLMKKARVA